jgi:hypothetical protein
MIRIRKLFGLTLLGFMLCCLLLHAQQDPTARENTTFYRDVLPILQERCQVCHRSGGIAPMAFENYEGTRRYGAAIQAAVQNRSMPPWFAEKESASFRMILH